MAHVTQTTVSTAIGTYLNKEYYDKNLLEMAKTKFVHAMYGQKRPVPKGRGKTVEFRRWTPFTVSVSGQTLTEGVTPDGQNLAQTHVEVTCAQYGAWVEVSDLMETTSFDDIASGATDMLGEQIGTVLDWVVRDAMCATTNKQFANGKTAKSAIAATDIMTVTEVRKAVRELKKGKARMFGGNGRRPHFICICGPDATFDLQSDSLWQDVSKYSNAEQIYSGEIGRIFGVVFVESTEAKIEAAAGASPTSGAPGADVYHSLIFGKDAYGLVDIDGSGAIESIVKGLGENGNDPLNQRASYGAKVKAFAATVLNNDWIIDINHGATA